jgi:amidohydrolase
MTRTSTPLLERAEALAPELVALRRDIHRHPELRFQEQRTAGVVVQALEGAGYALRTEVGRTGVVAEISSGPGPMIALRADMDALPILEANEVEYASEYPGVMHACGHDAHTAGLIGAARLLSAAIAEGDFPSGTLRLLFQPSEEGMDQEGKSGATRMIDDGAMEGVDAIIGLHVAPHFPAGTLYLREGPAMAGSDELLVDVRGRSAHAARPDEGVDALLLSAYGLVAAQQTVSRKLSPMDSGVVSFGTIAGGSAPNVLAEQVAVQGTLRYFTDAVRERLHAGVRGAFAGLEAMGGMVHVDIRSGYPPVINDPAISALLQEAFVGLVGPERVGDAAPWMGAEDFAILAREAPGCFFWLGAALPDPRELHHPRFDIDESVLPLGAAAMVAGARTLLERLR